MYIYIYCINLEIAGWKWKCGSRHGHLFKLPHFHKWPAEPVNQWCEWLKMLKSWHSSLKKTKSIIIYIYIPPRMHVPTGYICNLSYSICLFTYLPMCICMWIRIWLWNMQCNYLCRHTVCQNFKCTCTSLYTFVFISVNCNIYIIYIYIYRCCGMHGCVYTLDANVETHARSCKCEIV